MFKGIYKKNILITAGPTREYIDPVRYISNDSSGIMGFALAECAVKMGARVTLISGPVALKTPKGVRRIDVLSAGDMFVEVKKNAKRADIIIMAAAVADFRPKKISRRKIKKADARPCIALTRTADILYWVGHHKKKRQIVIGFALETDALIKNAFNKLYAKNCDMVVANKADVIGGKKTKIFLLDRFGQITALSLSTKKVAAKSLLKQLCIYCVYCKNILQ